MLFSLQFWFVAAGIAGVVIPNVLAFGSSIHNGLSFIDWFYPWPQNHKVFLAMPSLIRCHIVANGLALILGFFLVAPVIGPWGWLTVTDSFSKLFAMYFWKCRSALRFVSARRFARPFTRSFECLSDGAASTARLRT